MNRLSRVLWQNNSIDKCFLNQNIEIDTRTVFVGHLIGLKALDLNVARAFNLLKEKFLFVFGEKFTLNSIGFFRLKTSPLLFKKKKNNSLKVEFNVIHKYRSIDNLCEFEQFFYKILFWKNMSKYLRRRYRLQTGLMLKSRAMFDLEFLVVNPVFLAEFLDFGKTTGLDKFRFEPNNELLRIKITCVNGWIKEVLKKLIDEAA